MNDALNSPTPLRRKAKSKLASLSVEQYVYLLCGLGVVIYGLWIWVASLNHRNNSNEIQNVIVAVDQKGDNAKAVEEEKRKIFARVYKDIPLPDGSKLTEAERTEKLQTIAETPYGYEDFAYSMVVPKGWRQSSSYGKGVILKKDGEDKIKRPEFSIPTVINKYYGPAEIDMIPFLSVEFYDLSYQIAADTMLGTFMDSYSISPLGVRLKGKNHAEALYIDVIDQATFVVRKLFIINGKTGTEVTIAVPMDTYKDYASIMGAVISSFKFDKEPVIDIEQTRKFSLLGTLSIDYFPSWQVVNVNDDSSLSISFQLYNMATDNKTLNGLIELKALRINKNVSIKDTLEAYHKVMKEQGIEIKDVINREKLTDLKEDYNYAIVETYNADLITELRGNLEGIVENEKLRRTKQYFKLATVNNGNYVVFITLLGVTEDVNPLQFGRNLTQFNQVIRSLNIRKKK